MKRSLAGFTLIELMISLTIVAVIFVGVTAMFSKQLAGAVGNRDETELQASAQAALNLIAADVISAGLGSPDVPFAITNVGGTSAGADTFTVRSTFAVNRGMNSYMLGTSQWMGDEVPVRCWGQDGNGNGLRNATRDISLVPGFTTYLLFVSVFNAQPLPSVGANPVQVQEILPSGSTGCDTTGAIISSTTINGVDKDPAVGVKIASTVQLPRGTVIYAYLCPPCDASNLPVVTYSVDTANALLTQAGQPVLAGVEDFQVRFYSDPAAMGSPCPTGCDDITGFNGVAVRLINRIDLGLVVRTLHRDPHNIGDPRDSIETLGHTLTLDATMKEFSRKQFTMSVRPKNSTDFQ